MSNELQTWLHLALRWLHVLAGAFWIGQTAFFTWLDARFTVEGEEGPDGEPPKIWMVHSGGFYVVEKQRGPELLPRTLHWFRWEAALSWLSGIGLLIVVYYLGGALIAPDAPLSTGAAILVGVATLVVGWLVYDALWISPLARREGLLMLVSVALLVAVAWGLSELLSGRAAYIHVGALMGTVMTANVWQRILPAQRDLIAAARAGEDPDLSLAHRAKQRSKHNTFLTVPLVFIMISSYFPTTSYGHRLNWLMLAGFLAVGFAARRLMNAWDSKQE